MLIYGANGYTGELIVAEAVRRGLRPIAAGRDPFAVAAVAQRHGVPARVFGLESPAALAEAIAGAGPVLHCAGPFVHTSGAMVAACLAAGVSYLDITGEIEVFERIFAGERMARERGVVLLPGAGFDVVPTDCLARRLHEALPEATHLDLAFASDRGSWSRGTLATMLESAWRGGAERRAGP